MTHLMQELFLVKTFATEAERQLQRDDDFGNGLAVSLAQDGVELLLRIVVRERGIAVDLRGGFDKMVVAIDKAARGEEEQKVPHGARIEDLNKARVNFKHAGTARGRPDATRLARYGLEFLEVACPRFFAIEYRAISLVHGVRSNEVRGLLIEAERRLVAGNTGRPSLRQRILSTLASISLTSFCQKQLRPM